MEDSRQEGHHHQEEVGSMAVQREEGSSHHWEEVDEWCLPHQEVGNKLEERVEERLTCCSNSC